MKKVIKAFLHILKAAACLAYAVFFALCCYSWSSGTGSGLSAPLIGVPNVNFQAGSFPVDTEELTVVLQPGEVSLLDSFTALKSVDLSGSTCYDEFVPWLEAHPDVTSTYTVDLPSVGTVSWDTEELLLPGMDSQTAATAAERLVYLPKLQSIDLGSEAGGSSLKPSDLSAIQAACPDAKLSYFFSLAGQSVSLAETSMDLSNLAPEDVADAAALISCMQDLRHVNLGGEGQNSLTWEDVGTLQAANPETEFAYTFSLFGKNLSTLDETLDFNHIEMGDEGAAVRGVLPYMQNCTFLDMDFCGVSNEAMASIRDDFPNIKVVWRIWFGKAYSVRTDVEKILASKPSKGGVLDDTEIQVLKYCTDLKYLDIGHNMAITDLSFANYMPNLEVLVAAMNPIEDLSPLANCPHLEYLELNTTDVSDLSPLSGLTELRHLNIANCKNVTDISPLYGLTELERLWIGYITPVPAEQVAVMQAAAPECEINTEVSDPTAGRWRVTGYTELSLALFEETGWLQEVIHPRYELLREQFGYLTEDYSFTWLDPLYDPHD